jgi:RecA/RadA recombinase
MIRNPAPGKQKKTQGIKKALTTNGKKKKKVEKVTTKKSPLRSQIQKASKATIDMKKDDSNVLWVPSGSVMFNIRCSGKYNGAFKQGTMANVVGDSSSGKSIMVLSGLAWASIMPEFNAYRLIYDDAEFADSFDHRKIFGHKFTKRVKAPGPDGEMSTTIENFYDFVNDACDLGIPFIYVLDSFDAIDSDAEIEKELKNREHRKNKELSKIKGTFGATKQKKASQLFRHICSRLKENNSILIIISQTRDNLNAMSFVKTYRSGGKALKFYASIEAWMTYIGAIPKTIDKIKYDIGVNTRAKITKNKFTGKKSECDFPIFPDYGIDDVDACIDFLLKTKYWKKKKNTIVARELKFEGSKKKLIDFIEKKKKKRETKLFKAAEKCARRIEKKLSLGRLPKYG